MAQQVKKPTVEVKSHFDLLVILNMIDAGEYGSSIAKRLGWSKQRVFYRFNKLEREGFIKRMYRSSFVYFTITAKGQKFYTESIERHPNEINLHNVAFEYKIIKDAPLPQDKKVDVNNWVKWIKRYANVTIETIEKPEKKLIIHVSSLIGNNPYDLIAKAQGIARSMIDDYEQKFGIEVDKEGRLVKKPHFAVIDQAIKKVAKGIELRTDKAKIDESEGYGELEYFDPQSVKAYIDMPERIGKIESVMGNMVGLMERQSLQMDDFSRNVASHTEVIKTMVVAMNLLNDTIKGLNEKLNTIQTKKE